MSRLLLLIIIVAAATVVTAAVEPMQFDTVEQEHRYQNLMKELRCLVCQNQSLAESNAGLAGDLRKITHEMVLDNKSDSEIVEFLVSRYGDFVLYRPPVKQSTYLLWYGPLLMFIVALAVVVVIVRRRAGARTVVLDQDDKARLAELLKDSADNGEVGTGDKKS